MRLDTMERAWVPFVNSAAQYERQRKSGTYAMSLRPTALLDAGVVQSIPTVSLASGQNAVALTAWMQLESAGESRASLALSIETASGVFDVDLDLSAPPSSAASVRREPGLQYGVDRSKVSESTSSWTRRCLAVQLPPQASMLHAFVIARRAAGAGSVLLDDIELRGAVAGSTLELEDGLQCEWRTPRALPSRAQLHLASASAAPSAPNGRDDITLCLHGLDAHLPLLLDTARAWDGPVSIALFAPSDAAAAAAAALLPPSQSISLAVYTAPTAGYPVNALRAAAADRAPTDLVLSLDPGVVPARGSRTAALALARARSPSPSRPLALVLPAFRASPPPSSTPAEFVATVAQWEKSDLLAAWAGADAAARPWAVPAARHAATDFERWRGAKAAYAVEYRLFYAPYAVVRREAALWPEHVSGEGGKGAEAMAVEVDMRGGGFEVVPGGFVVLVDREAWKVCDAEAAGVGGGDSAPGWRAWYVVLSQGARKSGASVGEYLMQGFEGASRPDLMDTVEWLGVVDPVFVFFFFLAVAFMLIGLYLRRVRGKKNQRKAA